METKLFLAACVFGAFAFFIRHALRIPAFLNSRVSGGAVHVALWTWIGLCLGGLIGNASSVDGLSPLGPLVGSIAGYLGSFFHTAGTPRQKPNLSLILDHDREWAEMSFATSLIAFVLTSAVIQPFSIPSRSMEKTFVVGDHLFINKMTYGIRMPFTHQRVLAWTDVHRGDLIVFEAPPALRHAAMNPDPERPQNLIKRVIGLPNDVIEVIAKQVYINGQHQGEPYTIDEDSKIYPKAAFHWSSGDYQDEWEQGHFTWLRRQDIGDCFGPIRIPPDSYFVMGDNRDYSIDSRFWGPLPKHFIVGKACLLYWPFARFKTL